MSDLIQRIEDYFKGDYHASAADLLREALVGLKEAEERDKDHQAECDAMMRDLNRACDGHHKH